MRGEVREQGSMFSYVSLEARIPKDHPLRPMRAMVDRALESLSKDFSQIYSVTGRPSIPPEQLLRALLIQILYSVRSERQLVEQLEYNLLFRWFVGLGLDDPIWDPTTFGKNRDRLIAGEIARAFFDAVLEQARERKLLSSEHFTVDGTLIEAWASHKSFQPKKGPRDPKDGPGGGSRNAMVSFHGERRLNETHASTTDPESRLFRKKGKESRLAYMGHALTDNRHGLVVAARLTQATGYAEREAAISMLESIPGTRRITLGADRGYDTEDFIESCRALGVTPHVAQNTTKRRSRIDGRTTRHEGYAISQRRRKQIEEVFGWMKTIGLLRKVRHRGREKIDWTFTFTAAAYNLVRLRSLAVAS